MVSAECIDLTLRRKPPGRMPDINTPVCLGSQTSIEERVREDIVLRDIAATARADMRFGRYFPLKLAPNRTCLLVGAA
jgi:hypothetical protein